MKLTLLSAFVATAFLGACATGPTTPPELIGARTAVAEAARDSNVLSYAPLELKKATDSLARANELSNKGESIAEVSSAAYVANNQARAALALAQAKMNEEAIKRAEIDRATARANAEAVRADRAKAMAVASSAEAANARQQAEAAQQQAMSAQQQANAARQQAAAAGQQVAVANANAASAQQEAAMLQQQLTDLQAKATDRGMLVTLGDVLFETGSADIKPGARESLRKLATYLQQQTDRRVLIEGFTDSVGSDASNLTLSQRRADAVAAALAGMGVSGNRIATKGYGESYPLADNMNSTNRALNRRVEVYISDNAQPVRTRS